MWRASSLPSMLTLAAKRCWQMTCMSLISFILTRDIKRKFLLRLQTNYKIVSNGPNATKKKENAQGNEKVFQENYSKKVTISHHQSSISRDTFFLLFILSFEVDDTLFAFGEIVVWMGAYCVCVWVYLRVFICLEVKQQERNKKKKLMKITQSGKQIFDNWYALAESFFPSIFHQKVASSFLIWQKPLKISAKLKFVVTTFSHQSKCLFHFSTKNDE